MAGILDEVVIVDVSHWQGEMNWDVAKPKIHGAYIKGTDGANGLDPMFYRNKQELLRRNIPFGIYHWFKPDKDAKKQALWFSSVLDGSVLIPMVDIEEKPLLMTKNTMFINTEKFLATFTKTTGKEIGVYTRKYFWDVALPATDIGKRHPLWVAHYTSAPQPLMPNDWANRNETWLMWQWSADGNLRGPEFGAQSKSIDINRFNGGLAGIRKKYPGIEFLPLAGDQEPGDGGQQPGGGMEPIVAPRLKVLVSGLNLRDKPSTAGNRWFVMPKDTVVEVLEEITDTGGDVWVRVGQKQYAAKVYKGNVYLG